MSQKRLAETTEDLYERQYYSLIFENGIHTISAENEFSSDYVLNVTEWSKGHNLVIGIIGP